MADIYPTIGRTPTPYADSYRDQQEQALAESEKRRMAANARLAATLRERELRNKPLGYDPAIKTPEDYWAAREKNQPVMGEYSLSAEDYEELKEVAEWDGGRAAAFFSNVRTGAGIVESLFDVGHRALLAATDDETWESAGKLLQAREEEIARGEDAISQFLGIDEMMKFYNMRPDVQQEYPGWALAGQVTAALLDPTVLIPLAPFIKSGAPLKKAILSSAATGSGIAGADAALIQLARRDELQDVDWGLTGTSMLLGAALAPVLVLGGKGANAAINKMLGKQKATGDVSKPEVIEALQEVIKNQNETNPGLRAAFANRNPANEAANHNASLRQLFGLDEAPTVNPSGITGAANLTEAVQRSERGRRAAASKFPQVGLAKAVQKATDIKNEMTQAILQGDAVKAGNLLMPVIKATTPAVHNTVENARTPLELARATTDLEARRLVEQFGVPKTVAEARPDAYPADPKPKWDRMSDGTYEYYDDHIGYQIRRKSKKGKWELYRTTGRKHERIGQHNKLDDAKRAAIEKMGGMHTIRVKHGSDKPVQVVDRKTGRVVAEFSKGRMASARVKMDKLNAPTPEQESSKLRRAVREAKGGSQRGIADTQLLATLAGAGAGALVWEGDIGGVALGAGLGALGPRAAEFIRFLGTSPLGASKETLDKLVSGAQLGLKPLNVVRHTMGEVGEEMWTRIKRAQSDMDQIANTFVRTTTRTDKWAKPRYSKAEIAEAKKDARSIRQKVLRPEAASPLARRYAKDYQQAFEGALRGAFDAGVIDRKRHQALQEWAQKEGYFPRVYDDIFLHSKEGEELFLSRMTDFTAGPRATENDIKLMLSHILHDKAMESEILKSLPMVNGRPDPRLARHEEFAKDVLSRVQNRSVGSTDSKHLEKSRLISNDAEELLAPFLVKDPEDALSRYIHDVARRLAYAKEFGKDYKDFADLANKIELRYGEKASNMAKEIFWDRVGDPSSRNIQAAINQGRAAKRVLGQIDAFETLKLSMAQMINIGQAPINSSILASRMTGGNLGRSILKPVYDLTKDVKSPEFQRIADESAAAIETNLLQMVGEHTNIHHRLFGKNMEGPLDLINNPAKFLKATGFIDVEQFNRKLAANWGVITAKDLLRESAELQAQGKALPKRLDRAFADLGLPKGATSATEKELLTAGLRFSDIVNFRQQPGELPMLWTHPNAKMFTKFKSFAFNHGNFLFDNVVRPIFEENRAGAAGAAGALGLLATVIGVPISGLRALVKGDDEDWSITERWVHAFTATGGAGIFWDILRSKQGMASAALGPFVGDLERARREASQLISGKQTPSKMMVDLFTGTQVLPLERQLKAELDTYFD